MCTISGFCFLRVLLVHKFKFKGDRRSFVKVSISQVSDLCSFNFVTLNGNSVANAEPRCALPKGKAIAANGNLDVCLLLKMNLVIGH